MKFSKKLFKTNDGSFSIKVDKLNESYHSIHGAITESKFVYIQEGLSYWNETNKKSDCKIFEMGYGTGLNAYLSYIESQKYLKKISYTTVELYPLSFKEIKALNYGEFFKNKNQFLTFDDFSKVKWEYSQQLSKIFNLLKKEVDFEKFKFDEKYDIIFYDAFGYHAQPKLWEIKYMKKCYDMLNPGGVWVSYCAKGNVRRGLEKSGFEVVRLTGPPGKREILRALKV